MTNSIDTVMFDFGGVLVDLDERLCVKAFSDLGVPNITDYINKYCQEGMFSKIETGEISANTFYQEVRKMFDIEVTDSQIDEAWNAFLVSIPESKLNLLRELRKHYRVIMLSNTNSIHFEQRAMKEFSKQGLTLADYFDHCYLSYRLKLAKPDERIFRYVLKKEGALPQNILFIDDGEQNIETAKSLGFVTHLAREHEDFRPLFRL